MSLDVEVVEKCPVCKQWYNYDANITHNLGRMATAARIYKILWRPEEYNITKAKQLITPLKYAIIDMKQRPEYYKRFNTSNEWGMYKHFLPWLKALWKECVKHPNAEFNNSR